MRITGARYYRYSLPLTKPLALRGTTIDRRDGVIVAIDSDEGGVGYGEIAPLPGFSGESLGDAVTSARRCIDAITRRKDVSTIVPSSLREREMFPPSVRFGVESALSDMVARMNAIVPAALFTSASAATLRVNALLSGSPAEVLEGAQAAKDNGYACVKLKVGRGPIEEDVETVRELRRQLGDDVDIRLDANRAWAFDAALSFAHDVADCGIAYIEEPIEEPGRLEEFFKKSPVPLAVDETLQEAGWEKIFAWRRAQFLEPFAELPADADPLLRAILSARVWVVKPTLAGMPMAYTAKLLAEPRQIDADLVISSSFESGLGLAMLANLAACAGDEGLPAGLDTASWLAADVLDGPLPLRDGAVVLSEANAIVRRFSRDALEEVAND